MAKKGVSIGVSADTADVERGIKAGVIEPLEDAADTLQDLARAGDKAGEKLEGSMRDAQRDTDRLSDKFEELGREIRNAGRKGDDLKRGIGEGTDAAKRDLRELGDEAKQNLAETMGSFDGSVESLADGIQGTLGGVISNIGPLGAVAALGLAAITAEFSRSKERAAELKAEAGELAQAILDAGGSLDGVDMAQVLQDWALQLSGTSAAWEVFGDKTQTNLEAIEAASKVTRVSLDDMMQALAGDDPAKAADIMDRMSDQLGEVNEEITRLSGARMGGTERMQELRDEQAALEDGIQVWEDRTGMTREATDTARQLGAALDEVAASEAAVAEAERARTEASSALQSELDAGVASWQRYVDAESGAVDPGAYLAAMAERAAATTNFNSNVQSLATQFNLTQAEVQAILDQGVSFAPMLQSIINSGMAPEFVAQIQAAVGGGQEIINGTPLAATVTADADVTGATAELETAAGDRESVVRAKPETATAKSALDAVAAEKREAKITAKAEVTAASRDLDNVASKSRTAQITAGVDLSSATAQLNAWINQPRTVTVTAQMVDRSGQPIP